MRRLFYALGLVSSVALAQTGPSYGVGSSEHSGTITTTGVYQQVLPPSSNGGRAGCTIQNKSADTLLVFFGPTAPANSSGKGFPLAPAATGTAGDAISCGLPGGGVTINTVWIEGTTGDAFEYASQP